MEGLWLTDRFLSLLRYIWAFPLRARQEHGFWATSIYTYPYIKIIFIYIYFLNYKHKLSPGDI